MDEQLLNAAIGRLVDGWCERRALGPLRHILRGWPHNGLTDGLFELKDSLEKVRAFAHAELTGEDAETIDDAISTLQHVLDRR